MITKAFPIILSAPSGTGKTTLAHLMVESMADVRISVSYTTRPTRGIEREGVDYHFVDDQEFFKMRDHGDFLEWAHVHDQYYYGSSRAWTQKQLDAGTGVIFDIDVQGALQIRKIFPESLLIFVVPPSMNELKDRLVRRGTDSMERINHRMEVAKKEIETGLKEFDYVINNEKLERALFDMTSLVRAHRLKSIDREKIKHRLLGE